MKATHEVARTFSYGAVEVISFFGYAAAYDHWYRARRVADVVEARLTTIAKPDVELKCWRKSIK